MLMCKTREEHRPGECHADTVEEWQVTHAAYHSCPGLIWYLTHSLRAHSLPPGFGIGQAPYKCNMSDGAYKFSSTYSSLHHWLFLRTPKDH